MKTLLFILLTITSFAQQMRFTGSEISLGNGRSFSGIFIESTSGDTLTFGQVVFLYPTDNKMYLADGDVDSTLGLNYICVEDTILDGKVGRFLYSGFIKDTSKTYSGKEVCITSGSETDVTDNCVKLIGEVIDTNTYSFIAGDARISKTDSLMTEDLQFPVSAIRLPASNPPTSTAYLGTEVLEFPTNADATVYFDVQIPHQACDFNTDSTMYSDSVWVHMHCTYSADGSDPDSVRWVFTYAWANIDEQYDAPTTVNTTITVTDRVDSTHYMEGITYIPSSDKRFSSQLLMSLTRDVSEDDYGGSVYLMEIDIHYLRRDIW